MTTRTILFAGGGSGGHLTPGLAVAEELQQRDRTCEIVFATSSRRIERTILAGTAVRQTSLPVTPPGTARRHPIQFVIGTSRSLKQALRLVDQWRPEMVIGLGGFASVPVALAAWYRGVPLMLLEQNLVPGRATTWLSRRASIVCLSFDETRRFLPNGTRSIVTGNPLRRTIRALRRRQDATRKLIVLGGSQGAAGVNAAAAEAIVKQKDRTRALTIVHQTGERDAGMVSAIYREAGIDADVAAYFPDLASHYATAQLAISRAGATTLAELAHFGCPAVLMPYPRAVRDHQAKNAEHYAAAGGAVIVPEGTDAAERLARTLDHLLDDSATQSRMSQSMLHLARPDAAAMIADLVIPTSQGGVRVAA